MWRRPRGKPPQDPWAEPHPHPSAHTPTPLGPPHHRREPGRQVPSRPPCLAWPPSLTPAHARGPTGTVSSDCRSSLCGDRRGVGQEAGEGRAAGGAGRAQARWAGVPSMSCRTEGPGGAAPGLQWIRSSRLRLWKGGVREAGGEGLGGGTVGCRCGPMAGASVGYRCGFMGGRCGVQVWAHGGLQPLGLNSQKGQLPRGCPQGSQARCEHVTSQLQSKDGGEQRRNREDVWILTLPAR